MTRVTIHQAKTQLSKLIKQALEGEEIIIARGQEPLVKLVPLPEQRRARRIGGARGLVEHIAEDFNEPLEAFKDYQP